MAALVALVQDERAAMLEALARGATERSLPQIVDAMVEAAIAGETRSPGLARALDHEGARLALEALIAAAGRRIDAAITGVLAAHLPALDAVRAAAMARTMRVMARAIIDDRLNTAPGDPAAARTEAVAALMGYVERATRGACG